MSETRYKPWGEIRYSTGTATTPYTYTGQYSNTADFGWMYYKARWYDNGLGQFAQPDSIVPGAGDPRAWDRYAYVKNNPVLYNDPSGHDVGRAVSPALRDENLPIDRYGAYYTSYSSKISYGNNSPTIKLPSQSKISIAMSTPVPYGSPQNYYSTNNIAAQPVPTPSTNQGNNISSPGEVISSGNNFLKGVSTAIDLNEALNGLKLGKYAKGFSYQFSYAQQLLTDSLSEMSFQERNQRASVFAIEQFAVSALAVTTASELGLLTAEAPPLAIGAGIGVYLGMSEFGSYLADEANRQVIFPVIHSMNEE